jgi:spoIIIJ-associated protein
VELAIKQLGAKREEVEIEVLSRGKSGFLGLGALPARVRATVLPATATLARAGKEIVDQLLAALGTKAVVTISKAAPESPELPIIDIEGEDAGLLIGRRGQTLRSLQFLVNVILGQRIPEQGTVVVDVEHYRQRRQQTLSALALRVADQVAATRRSITLEPMPANERRIIHMALAQHPRVTTQSVGDGEERKVVVLPREEGLRREGPRRFEAPPVPRERFSPPLAGRPAPPSPGPTR